MSQPSAPYPGIYVRPKRRSGLDWAIRIVVALIIVAVAIAAGGAIRGDWGPWKTTSAQVSPSRQEVQGRVITEAQKVAPGIVQVTCVMPTAWTPGDTFKCYAYGSSGRELAQMSGTVLPATSGNWAANEVWVPV